MKTINLREKGLIVILRKFLLDFQWIKCTNFDDDDDTGWRCANQSMLKMYFNV